MSVREYVQDILALRANRELPTVYDGIKEWLKVDEHDNVPWIERDLDDLEPDPMGWETMVLFFFQSTMGTGLPVDARWETVRPVRLKFNLNKFPSN